jgi:hypothetical protein
MFARLTRGMQLGRLTLHAWLALAAFDVVRLFGFAWIRELLRRRPTTGKFRFAAEEIVWCVEEACVWYMKRAHCLQRSAVTAWLLRAHGIDAEMVIGFRPLPFESHAWVEVAGDVINDRPQYQKAFKVIDRI